MQSHNSGFKSTGLMDDVYTVPRQPIGLIAPITAPGSHFTAGPSHTDLQPKPRSVPAGLLSFAQFLR